jgi:hypothetical protein
MTHGTINRYTEVQTSQRCSWVARTWTQHCGGCRVTVRSVCNISTASLPVHPGSPVNWGSGSGGRIGCCSDFQTGPKPYSRRACSGGRRWRNNQRDGFTGSDSVSCGVWQPWLSGEMANPLPFALNTHLTVCLPPNWHRSTKYWSPQGSASSVKNRE